jgi:signal transduction histidine kinase
MSDELRTPLNAVIGYSEMLTEEINERKPQDIVPDLKKINDAGRHLLMLVTDVLDLSRIEAGKMEVYADTFEVLDLVEDVSNTAKSMASKNDNRFKVTCGNSLGSMHSDRHKIRQSILYLVNNAAKFAHERDLELQVTRKGSTIQFRMADLSPGLADDATNQLADAFTSANASSTIRFGGHGLGLVIAKHLCEMLGGTLKGDRQTGHSPVYTIELPDKAPSK